MKVAALLMLIAVRVFYGPLEIENRTAPFTSPHPDNTPSLIQTGKLTKFEIVTSSNKLLLLWMVNENETADQFEVQKSTDGKNFSLAALVFGTDKPLTDKYQFYEKVNSRKMFYRVKMIDKEQNFEYSSVIEIAPAKNI